MLRLRIRAPSGTATVSLPGDATYACLAKALETALPDVPDEYDLRTGYPPVAVADDAPTTLLSTCMKSGDTVVLSESTAKKRPREAAVSEAAAAPAPQSASNAISALAAPPPASEAICPAATPAPPSAHESVPMGGTDERMVRRVVPADNSCLFRCVGLVLEGSTFGKPGQLREVVASAVASGLYDEAMLGKAPDEYARWIRDPSHWGGGIELSILSSHFRTELCAYDVQTCRVDVFGQGSGYTQRAFLIYDGLHYDYMARTLFDGAPTELDVTVFDAADSEAMTGGHALVGEAHRARQFTDTASFTIRCLVCQRGLKGENDALEHAKKTGHTNFAEY